LTKLYTLGNIVDRWQCFIKLFFLLVPPYLKARVNLIIVLHVQSSNFGPSKGSLHIDHLSFCFSIRCFKSVWLFCSNLFSPT